MRCRWPLRGLEVLDRCFDLLVAVAVSSSWRGGWYLLDEAAARTRLSAAERALGELVLGMCLFFLLSALQSALGSRIAGGRSRAWHLVDALYAYLGLWCSLLTWRGAWLLWDSAYGGGTGGFGGMFASHCTGVGVLTAVGMLRSLNGAPMLIAADEQPLLGARMSPLELPSLARWLERPRAHELGQWRAAVGLRSGS